MTGWRVGYLGAPKWLAAACTKMQGQITSATCAIAQKATEAAVLADPKCTENMRDAFLRRRDLMIGKLSEIKGLKLSIPQGAFYIFPDVSEETVSLWQKYKYDVSGSNDYASKTRIEVLCTMACYKTVNHFPKSEFKSNSWILRTLVWMSTLRIEAARRAARRF